MMVGMVVMMLKVMILTMMVMIRSNTVQCNLHAILSRRNSLLLFY